jgi:hypothetical protein
MARVRKELKMNNLVPMGICSYYILEAVCLVEKQHILIVLSLT